METIDRAAEWRRLKELYAGITDEQLADISAEAYQLTELAKQALEGEIKTRRVDIKLAVAPPEPRPHELPVNDDFDPADYDLIPFRRVWDLEEARTAKWVFDNAGIPSFLGDGNVERLEDFEGSFQGGVDVKVPASFRERAMIAVVQHWPETGESAGENQESENGTVMPRCPQCQSEEVVLRGRDPKLKGNAAFDAKFRWRCDACCHKWEDDGIMS